MRETLFIQWLDGEQCRWMITGNGAPSQPESGSLSAAAEYAQRRQVVVFVPGEHVLLTQVALPGRPSKQWRNAVPYALEEQLAEDIDTLHFAIAPRQTDDKVPVAVIAKQHLDAYLEQLATADLQPDLLVPDILSTPLHQQDEQQFITLVGRQHDWLVRTGLYQGFAAETDLLTALLPEAAELQLQAGDADAEVIEQATQQLKTAGYLVHTQTQHTTLQALVTAFTPTQTLNLLQGDYARGSDYQEKLKPWRIAAVLLVAFIALKLINHGLQWSELEAQADNLDTQIAASFQRALPGKKMVNPSVQIERALADLQNGGGTAPELLTLLNIASPILAQNEAIDLQTLNFNNNRLELRLNAKQVQAVDVLKAAFAKQPNIKLEVKSVNASADNVDIRLLISGSRT